MAWQAYCTLGILQQLTRLRQSVNEVTVQSCIPVNFCLLSGQILPPHSKQLSHMCKPLVRESGARQESGVGKSKSVPQGHMLIQERLHFIIFVLGGGSVSWMVGVGVLREKEEMLGEKKKLDHSTSLGLYTPVYIRIKTPSLQNVKCKPEFMGGLLLLEIQIKWAQTLNQSICSGRPQINANLKEWGDLEDLYLFPGPFWARCLSLPHQLDPKGSTVFILLPPPNTTQTRLP